MPNAVTSLLIALRFAAQDPAEVDRVRRAGDPDAPEAQVATPARGLPRVWNVTAGRVG